MTIESLPPETVTAIVRLLDPVDAYVAKVCCPVLSGTPRSLNDIYRGFDRWDAYEVKARLEVPDAQSPLCALCRKRHSRTAFSSESLKRPAKIRCCEDSAPAIEIGQSRLTLYRIHRFLGLRSRWASDGSLRPSDTLIARNKEELHCPFFDGISNLYKQRSKLHVTETGTVMLDSTEHFSLLLRYQSNSSA